MNTTLMKFGRASLRIILLSLPFVLYSCGKDAVDSETSATADVPQQRQPVAVETLEITLGSLIPEIEASGVIRGIHEASLIPEATGKIVSVNSRLGMKVEKGDILFRIEDDLPLLNKDLAVQQLQTVQSDFEAIETSYKKGGVSRSDYNNAKSRLLQVKASSEAADKAFQNTRVRAPISGTLSSISTNISIGNYVTPGVPVGRIVDLTKLSMEIALGERQVSLVSPGMKAIVETSAPAFKFEATVEAVGISADQATASFPVKLVWDNSGGDLVFSGIGGRVTIPVSAANQSIVIPTSTIVVRDRIKGVFIVEGSESAFRSIETGETLGGRTLVLKGLKPGEQLIISALSAISNGYPVTAAKVGETGSWK